MVAGAAATLGGRSGDPRLVHPALADEFVASVGLCVHLAGEAYARRFDEVLRLARDLGVRHFRDDMRPDDDLGRWRSLFREAGIRAHLLVSPSTNTVREMVDYVRALGPAIVSAIEGQNEGDGPWFRAQPSARPHWAKAVIDYQRAVHAAVRAKFGAMPVVSPTVLDYLPADMRRLRAAAPYCDVVAVHAYVQAQQHPETSDDYAGLDWYLREMRDPFKPGAPVMITEAGYATGPAGVSPRAAAIYLPRMLLNAFDRGVVRSFLYEMFDEGRDPHDPEHHYGLIRADGTPKPAYDALRTLLAALSDPGPAFAPAPIGIELRGPPPDLRWRIFAKRQGGSCVALWRALPVWDRATRRDQALRPVQVQVVLERAPGRVSVRPIWPDAPWRSEPAGSEIAVVVSEVVTLLRLEG